MNIIRKAGALCSAGAVVAAVALLPATGAEAAGYSNPAPIDPTDVPFAAGAYVIDAGAVTGSATTQTVAQGIKPYGLVYALVKARIPVQWVVNPSKSAIDQTNGNAGTDFTFDCDGAGGGASKNYRTGAFIIEKQFAKKAKAIVDAWKTKGVVVDGPCAADTPTLPVFATIRSWPRTVINTSNAGIATDFFEAAEIPQGTAGDPLNPQAYRTALPSALTACDDVFAMPHADPTYADHSQLISFVKDGGSLWAGCHAVSVLENVKYPDAHPLAGQLAMNFLTDNGLLNYKTPGHSAGSPPYAFFKKSDDATSYYSSGHTLDSVSAGDPIAQFLGRSDAAHTNGSEQIYMPAAGSKWRPTTQIIEYDPSQSDVTSNSPGPAAVMVYGPAYGDTSNGLVMYEGGHDIGGTSGANVAAMRAFFNLLLLSAIGGDGGSPKAPQVDISAPTADASFVSGEAVPVSGSATGGSGGNTYGWSSECFDSSAVSVGSGSFDDATLASTNFNAPPVPSISTCNLTLTVIDSCGHVSFNTQTITVAPPPDTLDISVTKTSPKSVEMGKDFDYTIVVKNHGAVRDTTSGDGLIASDVLLSDPLPEGVTFVSVSTPSYSGTAPGGALCELSLSGLGVGCNLQSLEDEQSVTVTITVTMTSSTGSVTNTATVSTAGKETYKANNDDSANTSVLLPPTGDSTNPMVFVALSSVLLGGLVLAGSRRRHAA